MRIASLKKSVSLAVSAIIAVTVAACGPSGPGDSGAEPMAQIASDGNAKPAANKIDSGTPKQALANSIKAVEASGSYHVSGQTMSGSKIDISFDVKAGSTGTVNDLNIRAIDGNVLVSGDVTALAKEVDKDLADTIGDRWLLINKKSASGFAMFANGSTFAEAVLGSQGPEDITSVQSLDGKPAVGLVFPNSGGTLWIAADGKPYPLRFDEHGATAGRGILTFSDYGARVKIPKVNDDNVVDIKKIEDS